MSAMRHLLDLCKRRGFLFQSAEIHGGLRGAYDYGPMGIELKRNLSNEWWNSMVYQRTNIVGIDTAILTPPSVLKTSGHVDQFTDEMVDSKLSKERFRPDKAPGLIVDQEKMEIPILAPDKNTAKKWEQEIREQFAKGAKVYRQGKQVFLKVEALETDRIILAMEEQSISEQEREGVESGSEPLGSSTKTTSPLENVVIPYHGYVDPTSNSPFLTESRPFNLMFKTYLDPIDPIDKVITTTLGGSKSQESLPEIRQAVDKTLYSSLTYMRPETAQGVFINYATVQRSHPHLKIPFGIAQIGKSFRNEIRLEHAIFRTPEFEQMEVEYFVAPWQASSEFELWKLYRMDWWGTYARKVENFRTRHHTSDELAHYSKGCVDVEYLFPWGWGEVEGIANRGDFDLGRHSEATGVKLQYTDTIKMQERQDQEKQTGVRVDDPTILAREKYTPHVVESSCGLNRAMLAFMLDAMEVVDENGKVVEFEAESTSNAINKTEKSVSVGIKNNLRTVMRLHPRLAPIKVAILPLVSNNSDLMDICHRISTELRQELNCNVSIEAQSTTVGKRYYRMDEAGTPWCVTVDFESLADGCVTLRDRDSMAQTRIKLTDLVDIVQDGLRLFPKKKSQPFWAAGSA